METADYGVDVVTFLSLPQTGHMRVRRGGSSGRSGSSSGIEWPQSSRQTGAGSGIDRGGRVGRELDDGADFTKEV